MSEVIQPVSVRFIGRWAEEREEFGREIEHNTPFGEWTEYGFTNGILRVENEKLFHEKVSLQVPGPLVSVGGNSARPPVVESLLKRDVPVNIEIEGQTVAIVTKRPLAIKY